MRTLLLALWLTPALALAAPDLTTEAERSGFERTGRYDEIERLCPAFAAADPTRVRCARFGTTPEGRPMLALIVADDLARAHARPAILVQGGIHAGEIEGKDALIWSLRELLDGKMAPGALAQVTLVLVPVFNVDGHERFGPNHRPNQRGPREVGFRTTAQNLNLNRDYVKAEAPEMQALLELWAEWDPVVLVDLHTTDGAQFEPDVSITVAPDVARADGLDQVARRLGAALIARVAAMGHLPLDFYPSFKVDDDPASGFEIKSMPPRYSHAYAGARGRIGILVETHSWKPYRVRVATTHDVLAALFERAVVEAGAWKAAAAAADAADARLAGTDVVLATEPDPTPRMIDFRGYAYEIRKSVVSNGPWIVYDETRPQIWRERVWDRQHPSVTVRAPAAGYVVPAAFAPAVAAKLRLHGLRYRALPAARDLAVDVFRGAPTFGPQFEGRTRVALAGAWRAEAQHLAAGSLFVPIDQPHARLVLHLLDPAAPDSLVSWGFFSAVFEQKEYMEEYVLEAEADRMRRADPKLDAAFEAKLGTDPTFADSPKQRLRFFYQRHPAWDERLNLVPVFRVDREP